MSINHRIIFVITTLAISCISVYLYTVSLIDDLGYYNKYEYRDGLFVSAIELLIYLGLSTFFLQKMVQNKWRILLATFLYFVVLQELFFNLGFSLRSGFGATWTNTEVRFELVLYYKKTLVLLSVSVIIYYLLLRFLKNKNTLDVTSINHKKT